MACSTVTRCQSASNSSAATIGSAVRMPVPISERCATMITAPDGSRPRYTLGDHGDAAPSAASASGAFIGSTRAARISAPAENMLPRRPRRLTSCTSLILVPPRLLNRLADTLIGPTTADIALHGRIDVLVCRLRLLLQQRHRLHDLPGLAVATLRHVQRLPGLLDRMVALG